MLGEHNATVLPFRDSALRRPIDIVASKDIHGPDEPARISGRDNVVPLARSTRSRRFRTCSPWLEGPPDGEAA